MNDFPLGQTETRPENSLYLLHGDRSKGWEPEKEKHSLFSESRFRILFVESKDIRMDSTDNAELKSQHISAHRGRSFPLPMHP